MKKMRITALILAACMLLALLAGCSKQENSADTQDEVTLPIQINGKRRGEVTVPKDMPQAEVEKLVLADETVVKVLAGAAPRKLIVVPGRIVNVVA